MTISTSAQKELDAILALLEENRDVRPVKGRSFRGTNEDDVFFGRRGNVSANGRGGNDALIGMVGSNRFRGGQGDDLLMTGNGVDNLSGDNGNDVLVAGGNNDQLNGGNNADSLNGGIGADTLLGGNGNDQLVGSDGIDNLTGGAGNDQFIYTGNLFANGTPVPVPPPANAPNAPSVRALNQPDIITDYTIGQDQFVFDRGAFANNNITFQKGNAAQIADGNVIVLTNGFAAAGAAARAIASNPNIQSNEGVFVYFNTTLGLNRVVYSTDLSDGGSISVLANLNNQQGQAGLAALASFTAADFAAV